MSVDTRDSNLSESQMSDLSGGDRTEEDADALYMQGMAHYRRREWKEAKACFVRLKAMAPDRRGVDALLNEVDIFIQLQAMQPEQEREVIPVRSVEEAPPARNVPTQETRVVQPSRRAFAWPAFLVVVLAVLMGIVLLLYTMGIFDNIIGNQRQAQVQALVNQGRAAMNVGEYDRAVQAFGEALALAPNNEEVKTWYTKAQHSQQLASLDKQAEADIAAGQLDSALEKLEKIKTLDPVYRGVDGRDVNEKIASVKSQQELEARFTEAQDYFKQDKWSEAIQALEQLRDDAPSFKTDEVQQTLFLAYFRYAVALITSAPESSEAIGQAIQTFDRALAIFPNDKDALEERRLANLYRQSYLSSTLEDWPQAISNLEPIYSSRPDYLGGRVPPMLCTAYLRLGDAYREAGQLEQALQQYRNVLAITGCDHREAAAKEHEVYTLLYPPTPTPTRTPMPTRTPLPTATWTPTALPPPPPTSPPPPPATPRPTR